MDLIAYSFHLPLGRALVRVSDTGSLIKNDLRENSRAASSTFESYDWFTASLNMNLSMGMLSTLKKITATLSTNP